jgi:hypothetical protein
MDTFKVPAFQEARSCTKYSLDLASFHVMIQQLSCLGRLNYNSAMDSTIRQSHLAGKSAGKLLVL